MCIQKTSLKEHMELLIPGCVVLWKECDKVVLNNGMATRWFSGGESHTNLAFLSPGCANMAHWEVLGEFCGSDHNIVSMEFQSHVRYGDPCNPRLLF